MIKNLILFLVILFAKNLSAQDKSFFANGYVLNNKDTTWCRIWLDPDKPYFNSELVIWLNDEVSKVLSLSNNDSLTGFGITEKGYEQDLGKVITELPAKKIVVYAKKLVTGPAELYRYAFSIVKTNQSTEVTTRENYEHYYLGRTDTREFQMPEIIYSLSVKKIKSFFADYPGIAAITRKYLTTDELITLVQQYNEWYQQNKKNGN